MALIRQADQSVIDANKAGVAAVMALIQENIQFRFPHGKAAELADILKDGKVAPASAKRYAELCAMAVNAIAHQGNLAASKAPNNPTAKGAARDMALADSLATLTGLASMSKVREWAKENGPKAKAKAKKSAPAADVPAADVPAADVPAADVPAAPATIEAIGQLREVRECLAMVNSGMVTQAEAIATIAEIVGIQLTKSSLPAPAGKARTNGQKKTSKAV